MRELLIVLVPVLLIGTVAGGGIWLSQREEPAAAAGTLVGQPVEGPLLGRSTDVRVPSADVETTYALGFDEPVGVLAANDLLPAGRVRLTPPASTRLGGVLASDLALSP